MKSPRSAFARALEWWPAAVMMLGTLLSFLDRQVLGALSPTILKETHLTATDYSNVVAAFSYAYMVSTLIWGPVLDRIGLRIGMAISIAMWAVASASHSLVSTFLGFAAARAALGIGEGSMFPGGFRTAMDSLPPEKQSRGVALAYSGSSLGSLLAPLIIIPVALRFGWRLAFLVTPAAALAWLAIWLITVKPSRFAHQRRAERLHFPNLFELRFWRLVVSYGLGSFPVGAVTYLAPLYLSRAFGVSQKDLGYVLWIPPFGLELGYFFWGWIVDRFAAGNPRPLRLLLIMSTVALASAAVSISHGAAAAIALLSITLFASGGLVVVTLRAGAMTYGSGQRAMTAGIASSSFSASVAILLPLCGRLFDAHLYDRAFLMVGLAPLVGTLIWWMLPVPRRD